MAPATQAKVLKQPIFGNPPIANIPWDPVTYPCRAQAGDWINNRRLANTAPLEWVYHVTQASPNTVEAIEYQRISRSGLIKGTSHQEVTLSTKGYHPIMVLRQERHGSPFKVARELLVPTKPTPLFWIFESGFIKELPWDLGEWHWQGSLSMGDSPFFRYFAKRGN
jgi:hypothetical protein